MPAIDDLEQNAASNDQGEYLAARRRRKSRKRKMEDSKESVAMIEPANAVHHAIAESIEGDFQTAGRRKKGGKRKLEDPESVEMTEPAEAAASCVPGAVADATISRPHFPPLKRIRTQVGEEEIRKVPVPANRYSPLKSNWLKIFSPVVEQLKLQIRFNLKTRNVEIRTSKDTKDERALQKACDFVTAFVYGFDVEDALALLRLDDLFVETFKVQDVKPLKGDHLSRAIGRLSGKGGKTKFTIENVTKTRIVLADSTIHILGSYQNISIARRAVCNLILGSPPSKVYGSLRSQVSRASERF